MGKVKNFFSHPAPQIFLACLIPNLGSWIIWILLADKIKEQEAEEKVKSFLEPPDWVRIRKIIINIWKFLKKTI